MATEGDDGTHASLGEFRLNLRLRIYPSHLNHHQVVYVSDTSGYIPLTALQSSHPRLPPPPVYGGDIDAAWRPDPWDRDYNRRYRFNNTRVQREYFGSLLVFGGNVCSK